ncbi:DEAD/DEAH box helicase family protein [Legionella pneumophila serogroup 1]|uniref:DEAD/DEAH box helicase family protein n=2 Tax=Legionella pneumophila TaxID=446 RepID=UPI00077074C2|nr:DEAD/DEAH box helicase family protein [Legionella pneumophila]HAT8874853.1 hypothetical protein [Legionella pneumophila subsp. pneumophila]CZG51652.1 Uncharacterized protein conserved in bacteria [Legionella pneumophila]CZG65752.1 Uncharacterized protein conserved in bacteria [Legionella pneumophila]HAT8948517.1 hypothetical protein [Legionella pneumophila subsp. pneumophila]HAT9144246.1 hypothetical protein [Legionella pneumophila subsp. pneumophila]
MKMDNTVSILPIPGTLHQSIKIWRNGGYKNVTNTTKRLLEWWFIEEHELDNGIPFRFWEGQREAIEHLIYCYEVLQAKSLYELVRQLDVKVFIDPREDKWTKYAFKMATGSGKTIVMAMVIVWSYFNAQKEDKNKFSKNFVLIASNLIVLDRLLGDSANPTFFGGGVFKQYPFIPSEWISDFHVNVMSEDELPVHSKSGLIYLINWQKFIERDAKLEDNPVQVVLGSKPPNDLHPKTKLKDILANLKNILVINDEAHHVWDEELIWYKAIDSLHTHNSLMCQLDFSATPKDQDGNLFPHIIMDYNLGRAIEDNIVKRPKIAELRNVPEIASQKASERYKVQIDAGVAQWRKVWEVMIKAGKKPVLFIMAEDNKAADDVANYLENFSDLTHQILTIHSARTKGQIADKDLDMARKAAREIDSLDNPYRAIVSVLMLREGWDVRNVSVVVPLRSYSSKAKILPEQTLGRGLRRMWPEQTDLEEQLIVIEHPQFHNLIEEALKEQGVKAKFYSLDDVFALPELIQIDNEKLQYDIEIPILIGGLTHSITGLERLDFNCFDKKVFEYDSLLPNEIILQKVDMLTKKLESEEILEFPFANNPQVYIASITHAIIKATKIPGQFYKIAPIVKNYIINNLFDKTIELENIEALKKLNLPVVRKVIISSFIEEINKLVVVEETPILSMFLQKASEIKPFQCSVNTISVRKTILNKVPYSNELEKNFLIFLDHANDVKAFIKNETRTMNLKIPYVDHAGFLRNYIPDFVVKTPEMMLVVETKGRVDIDVAAKDAQTKRWTKMVSERTNEHWEFLRVNQCDFDGGGYNSIHDFLILASKQKH